MTSESPIQQVLVFPGLFRIDARCSVTGDALDVNAATGVDNSEISTSTISTQAANDLDGVRDLSSSRDIDFDTGEAFAVDATGNSGRNSNMTVHFTTPAGFTVVVHLQARVSIDAANTCTLTGTAIGG